MGISGALISTLLDIVFIGILTIPKHRKHFYLNLFETYSATRLAAVFLIIAIREMFNLAKTHNVCTLYGI